MIDQDLLDSFSTKDKTEFSETLLTLIEQTFEAEKEYKSFKLLINSIIDSLPNAMWVVLKENSTVFLQNSESKDLNELLNSINLSESESESEFNGRFYLIKITFHEAYLIISATDITEHKRKERLAHMGQIAAHLAHEIRNPIASVSLFASSLLKNVNIKSKPIVYEIKKSIWRVERIIKMTLEFSKGIHAQRENFELHLLGDELDEAIANYTYSKDIDFVYKFPQGVMFADLELLSLVFQNLLFNAIDAIEEDDNESGLIEVSYFENSDYYVISIFDSGVPIENPKKLFEAYETTKTKGNGLGLALVLQIIEAHEGYINLTTVKKGFEIGIKKI